MALTRLSNWNRRFKTKLSVNLSSHMLYLSRFVGDANVYAALGYKILLAVSEGHNRINRLLSYFEQTRMSNLQLIPRPCIMFCDWRGTDKTREIQSRLVSGWMPLRVVIRVMPYAHVAIDELVLPHRMINDILIIHVNSGSWQKSGLCCRPLWLQKVANVIASACFWLSFLHMGSTVSSQWWFMKRKASKLAYTKGNEWGGARDVEPIFLVAFSWITLDVNASKELCCCDVKCKED